MPKRPFLGIETERRIRQLAAEGYRAAQIHAALAQGDADGEPLPSLRTVQKLVKESIPADTSAPWHIGQGHPQDAPAVLRVLAAVVTRTRGRVSSVSCSLAERIAVITQAAPDLPAYGVYLVATEYARRAARSGDTADLELFLAFRPWRDAVAEAHYTQAAAQGRIKWAPAWIREGTREAHEAELGVARAREALTSPSPAVEQTWEEVVQQQEAQTANDTEEGDGHHGTR